MLLFLVRLPQQLSNIGYKTALIGPMNIEWHIRLMDRAARIACRVVSHELLLYDISTTQMTPTHHHADVTATNNAIMNWKWYMRPAWVLEHLNGKRHFSPRLWITAREITPSQQTITSLKFIQIKSPELSLFCKLILKFCINERI